MRRFSFLFVFFIFIISPISASALTRQIPLSGQLLTPGKQAVPDGDYTMRFAIYTADRTVSDPYPSDADSTARILTETQTVKVERGLWKVILGSATALPDTLNFETGNYYLGIRINTDSEMTPRKKILPVPQALNSESVGGAKPGTGNNNILKLDSAGAINIAGNITTAGILQGANLIVGTSIQLPANSILTADISDGTISTVDLADGLITGVKIADNSVSGVKLADNAVSVSKIANGAITTVKLSDGSVSTAKLADLAVTTAKIANASITAAKLFTGDLHFQNTDTGTTSLSFCLGTSSAIGTNNFSLTASNAANKPAVRYNGTSGKWQISNDGAIFADIGSSLSSSLQAGYDAGNTITTADNRNILFTLADTATDSSFLINIQGTGNSFQIQDAGTPIFTVADGGLSTFGGNINLSGNRIVSTSRIDGYASGTFLYTAVDVRSAGSYSSLAMDSSNYPHIAYYTSDGSTATIADWDGTQWTVTDFDSAGVRGYNIDLVIDGAGVKHAVYEEQITADSNLIYAKYVGSGGNCSGSTAWSCTTVDSTGNVGSGGNSIDVDGSNVPHISYYDATNGDLKHAWYVGSGGNCSGSTAWNCETVESANNVGSGSSIAVNRTNGDIHISYYDATNGDLRYVKRSGGVWSAPVNLDGSAGCIAAGCGARDAGNYSYGSNLVLTASGNPRVAYLDNTNYDLYYAYSNDRGTSWTTTKIDGGAGVTGTGCSTSGNYGQYPSLTLDSAGNPNISYYDSVASDLRYASNNGSAWTCQTLDSANTVGLYSSIKMTSSDKAYISYQDYTNADLKIVSNNYPKLNIYSDVAVMGETGNLGIGVLQPTERLDVAGNIKTTGNISSSLAVIATDGFVTTGSSNYIPIIYGGSTASGNFTISSTSNSGRGNIYINPGGKFTVIGNSAASASIANAGLQITPNYLFIQYRYYNPGTGYTYSGNTGEANSFGGTPFTLVSAVGDMAYFGSYQPFNSLEIDLAALGAGGAVAWEYYNGAAWVSLAGLSDGTSNLMQDGIVSWTTTLSSASVNGYNAYWIRANVSATAYTTAPTANSTIIGQFGTSAAPLVASLIQPAGIADSTTWSATGTMLGINASWSFNGNLVDLKVGGNSRFTINSLGNVGIGMGASSNTKLSIVGVGMANNDIVGISEFAMLSGLGSASLYGNKLDVVTSTVNGSSTFYGQAITVTDISLIGPNAAYGLFVDNAIGLDAADERYGIVGTSRGVGILGKSDGSGGSPTQYGDGTNAAVFAQYSGTTAGNALRAYSNTITSSNLFALNQNTSAFSGNMLFANMANASGSFTGNFVNLQVNGSSKFIINSLGSVGVGIGSPTEKLTVFQNAAGTGILGLWDGANNNVVAVADGGGATFKPAAFDAAYNFNGVATYTDDTIEAKTSLGTAFNLLALEASSNDEFYVGLDHPYATIYADIATVGVGITLSAQYWNGGWSALALTDNTASLTADGTITFTAPADWTTTSVNGATKYWVRLRSPGTNITTAPTAFSISPTSGTRLAVYGQAGDANSVLHINDKGAVSIGSNLAAYKFDVKGSNGATYLGVNTTNSSPMIFIGGSTGESGYGSTNGRHTIRFHSSGVEGDFFWNEADDRYYFKDYNNNYSPVIAGMLGLNTATPTAALQVQATSTSSGATTMTATNGATTFTTSVSTTINAGDYVIPTTTTGQARSVTIGGTGTSFTVTPAFSAAVTAETFTIYPAIANLVDNSGNTGLFLQGSTRNVGIGTASPIAPLHLTSSTITNQNGASQFYQNASFTQTNVGVTNYGFKMETNQSSVFSDDRVYGIHVSRISGGLYAAIYGSGNDYGVYGNGVTGVYGDTAGWSGGIGVNGKSVGGVGIQAETTGAGTALKALSSTITSSDLFSLSQDTSAFSGNMLFANMANASGSFTGNFINLQVNGSSKFVITSAGNVGIGTATPNAKLSLGNSMSAAKLLFYDGGLSSQGGNGYFASMGFSGNVLYMTAPTDGVIDIGRYTAQDLGGRTNWLYMNNSGNVGINQTSPTAKLHVQGGTIFSGATTMTASNGASTFTTSASITINAGDYIIPTTTTGQARSVTVGGAGTSFTVSPTFSANVTAETFTIYPAITNLTDNSGNTGFFLQGSTRNVGINTAAPSGNLDIRQIANGNQVIYARRNTDTTPTGNFLQFQNAAGNATLFQVGMGYTATNNGVAGIQQSMTLAGGGIGSINYGNKDDIAVTSNNGIETFYGHAINISYSAAASTQEIYGFFVDNSLGTNSGAGRYGIVGKSKGIGIFGASDGSSGTPVQYGDGTNASVFAQYSGTTAGNALRAYSNTITSSNLFALNQGASAFSGNMLFANMANASGSFTGNFVDFQVNGVNKLKITNTGATAINLGAGTLSGNLDIRQIADGTQVIYARRNTDTTPTGNFIQFQNAAGSATLFAVDVDGNIGIGGVPVYRFDVAGTGSLGSVIRLRNTGGPTNGLGTQILFAAERTTSGVTNVASISGIITDITQTAYKGALVLSTANNAAPVEQARIDYLGNVSFGVNVTGGTTTIDLGGTGTGNAVCHTTQTGTDNEGLVDCTAAPIADYAEMYPVASGIEYGDIVAVGTKMIKTKDGDNIAQLVKSSAPYQSTTVGIVSNNYGDFTSAGYNIQKEDNPKPVALNGRVPVKVSLENGPIAVGDPLTSSSVPGVAMKAMGAGYVIGKALEPFTELPTTNYSLPTKILVFVSPSWYTPLTGPLVQGSSNQFDTINIGSLAITKDLVVTGLARIKGDLIVEGKIRGDLEVEGVVKAKGIVGGWRSYENHFLNSKFENDLTASLLANGQSAASWEYHKVKLATDPLAGSKATLDHSFNFKPADDENGASWRFMIKTKDPLPDLPLSKGEYEGVFRFGLYSDEQNYALIQNGTEAQTLKFISCAVGECTTTDNISVDPAAANRNYVVIIKQGEAKLLIDGQEYAKHITNVPADSILHFYESVAANNDAAQSIMLDYLGVIVGRYEPF